MPSEPYEALLRSHLDADLAQNIEKLRRILNSDVNADAQFRRFHALGRDMCAVYIEGMADEGKISEYVLRACAAAPVDMEADATALMARVLEIAQCDAQDCVGEMMNAVITGMTALLIDGCAEAVMMETRCFPARPVSQTTNEPVVLGAQEGFVENLRTNITLIRRYVPSVHLITERLTVGRGVPCQVCMAYLEGVADPRVVARMRRRLRAIDRPWVQGLGAVQQLIEDSPMALLPQMLQTERPDRAASCVLEGQVVLLADNSPCALAAPVTLFHLLHASDDSFARWQYGTFLRLIRMAGILISLFLPGVYVALADYHMHLIPLSLLGAIAEARTNVPFPVLAEVLIMEFSFYLINEAGTRIPRQIGSALGIVGALILGQAAVSASIISPMLIIIVALTGLGNFAVPNYSFGLALVVDRLLVVFAAAAFGLYGVCVAAVCLLTGVCGMTSLGVPYVAPVAPSLPHNPDILTRLPLRMQRKPMFFAVKDSWLSPDGGRREA